MMNKKLMGSIAATAILLGGAYGISEVQGASAQTSAVAQSQGKTLIGMGKAEELALKSEQGRVVNIELEKKFSGLYYDVEIRNNNQEIEVRLDAYTGKIVRVSKETDDDDFVPAQGDVMISAAKAAEVAAASVKGKVTEVDLDHDNGSFVYEVEIKDGKTVTEVGVDAQTAKIVSKDVDFDDDDDDDQD